MRSTCAVQDCGKPFEAKRSDARYCSAACRARASRARRRGDPIDTAPEPASPTPTPPRPDTTPAPSATPAVPDPPAPDRLARIEERLLDLEADIDAAERERNVLLDLRHRLEGNLRRAEATVEEVEERVETATEPFKELLPELVTKTDLDSLRSEVYRLDSRLDHLEHHGPTPTPPERRLAEVERAATTLARRYARLRREFDTLVQAIADAP